MTRRRRRPDLARVVPLAPQEVAEAAPDLVPVGQAIQDALHGAGQLVPGGPLPEEPGHRLLQEAARQALDPGRKPGGLLGQGIEARQQAEQHPGAQAREHLAKRVHLVGGGLVRPEAQLGAQGPQAPQLEGPEVLEEGQLVGLGGGRAVPVPAGIRALAEGEGEQEGLQDGLHQRVLCGRCLHRGGAVQVPAGLLGLVALQHDLVADLGDLDALHASGQQHALQPAQFLDPRRPGSQGLQEGRELVQGGPALDDEPAHAPLGDLADEGGEVGAPVVLGLAVEEGPRPRDHELDPWTLRQLLLQGGVGRGHGILGAWMGRGVHLHGPEGHGQGLGELEEVAHAGVAFMGSDHSRRSWA